MFSLPGFQFEVDSRFPVTACSQPLGTTPPTLISLPHVKNRPIEIYLRKRTCLLRIAKVTLSVTLSYLLYLARFVFLKLDSE
ncbi:hypothetical protein LshimejAT787_1301230 [Lyophyllum shimeji]|uniref:Uncharacterized protein n=1 Tax=Lyophyllum shimeji TaxID=47721 RepID=A0A9P3PUM9_LYOSH|nr:hypothetical protein LshimejAT787_1301230 [Lyophyllum shimeji]